MDTYYKNVIKPDAVVQVFNPSNSLWSTQWVQGRATQRVWNNSNQEQTLKALKGFIRRPSRKKVCILDIISNISVENTQQNVQNLHVLSTWWDTELHLLILNGLNNGNYTVILFYTVSLLLRHRELISLLLVVTTYFISHPLNKFLINRKFHCSVDYIQPPRRIRMNLEKMPKLTNYYIYLAFTEKSDVKNEKKNH